MSPVVEYDGTFYELVAEAHDGSTVVCLRDGNGTLLLVARENTTYQREGE